MHILNILKTLIFFSIPTLLLAAPTNPSNLALIPNGNSITLSWQDNAADESAFKIFRDGNIIGTVGENITTYHDSGLDAKTIYRYTVKATDSVGEDKKATLLSPLNGVDTHNPTFTWKMIDDATTYTIMVRPLNEDGVSPDWSRIILY